MPVKMQNKSKEPLKGLWSGRNHKLSFSVDLVSYKDNPNDIVKNTVCLLIELISCFSFKAAPEAPVFQALADHINDSSHEMLLVLYLLLALEDRHIKGTSLSQLELQSTVANTFS